MFKYDSDNKKIVNAVLEHLLHYTDNKPSPQSFMQTSSKEKRASQFEYYNLHGFVLIWTFLYWRYLQDENLINTNQKKNKFKYIIKDAMHHNMNPSV